MNQAMANSLSINSTSIKNGEFIPVQYTCLGQDISPAFNWSDASPATKSFALICADPDAPTGTWYHWILFNIPSTTRELLENKIPDGSQLAKNSWGKKQYNGPCPPPGATHHYVFTLYALNTLLDLPDNITSEAAEKAIQQHTIDSVTLTGLFKK